MLKMKSHSRRTFLKSGMLLSAAAATGIPAFGQETRDDWSDLLTLPILNTRSITVPVIIETVEVLEVEEQYIVRVRARGGAEGVAAANPRMMSLCYPIFQRRIVPVFLGKDARDLESLLTEVYLTESNYKWQGLPFWSSLAAIEFALLDLLGKIAGVPVGELLGGVVRRDIAVYHASEKRGNSPEAEMEYLQRLVDRIGNKAVKFRLGARMRYDDASTRRDKALIPLVRKVLGDDATLYADANGSYDVPLAIEIGRMMQDYGYDFYEEPVPFDAYEETREVAKKLRIPVALGEQEPSMRQFLWMARTRAVGVLQPDLVYFGGLIRAVRVAKMAERAGLPCTPHMSGNGMGFLFVLHYASCVPNAGPYQEYKGLSEVPVTSDTSSLKPEKGKITTPSGPGLGVTIDPDFVAKGKNILK